MPPMCGSCLRCCIRACRSSLSTLASAATTRRRDCSGWETGLEPPDLTVVCFGLNDACRGDETQEEYASALDGIFTKLKEAGSEIIFMTPNMMNTRLSEKLTVPEIRAVAEDTLKIQLDGRLERYLDAAREVCTRQGAAVCDCYAKWKLLSQNGVDTTALLANGINHPSREMAWMFAYSLLETMMR